MANTTVADAAAPKTPPHDVDSGPELNSTPLAVGSTAGQEEEDEGNLAIPQKVYEITKGNKEGKVNRHIPEMVWFHKFEDPSTANIRKLLELKDAERGKRVLHIVVSRKLRPITKLSGRKFLSAWWHIVVCHYALWGLNVHHCDVSPNNLVVYKASDGRYIGVLIDFDFSSARDGPSGQERIGTVPFMAIKLLTQKGIEGQVKHLYRHDAKSFIWVLTWVCLRYQEGQLLRKGRPLDEWLKVDIDTCREKKYEFLYAGRRRSRPSPSHTDGWTIAQSSLRRVSRFYMGDPESSDSEAEMHSHPQTDAAVFDKWFKRRIHRVLSPELLDVHVKSTSL